MKKLKKVLPVLIMVIGNIVSFILLLTSPIQLQIKNTRAMGQVVIKRVVSEADNPNLQAGLKFIEKSGLEQTLLDQLPKKYQIQSSYADLYGLCEKYNHNGRITTQDLNLTGKSRLENIINEYVVKQINYKLKKDSAEVDHLISIYQYSIFVFALLFLLAAILIIFGRYWASVPLVVGALGSFAVLWFVSTQLAADLQQRVYRGLTITLSPGIWWGLVIGVAIAITWPIYLNFVRRKKK